MQLEQHLLSMWLLCNCNLKYMYASVDVRSDHDPHVYLRADVASSNRENGVPCPSSKTGGLLTKLILNFPTYKPAA